MRPEPHIASLGQRLNEAESGRQFRLGNYASTAEFEVADLLPRIAPHFAIVTPHLVDNASPLVPVGLIFVGRLSHTQLSAGGNRESKSFRNGLDLPSGYAKRGYAGTAKPVRIMPLANEAPLPQASSDFMASPSEHSKTSAMPLLLFTLNQLNYEHSL